MKNTISNLIKKIEETEKNIEFKKSGGIHKLEEIKSQFSKEINRHIEAFYRKKDLVREAFKQKLQLRRFKISFLRQLFGTKIRFLLSIPFIYAMIIPVVILHIFLEIYHRICFPLYGIHVLKTSDYFVFDRQYLTYLNWYEKFNCMYCSYCNCLLSYAREIAALTELYWCPIKHARRIHGTHNQYHYFVDYLEGRGYRVKKEALRSIAKKGKADGNIKEEKS